MQDNDFQFEQQWLDSIYAEIGRQLARQTRQDLDYREQMREIRTSLWQDLSGASDNKMMDIAQQIAELRRSAMSFGVQHHLLKQLQTAEKAPYFGRIDFHEEGFSEKEKLYIGIRSLIDQEDNVPLVYDWRAPVSSMFYDYGLGEASYEGPGGIYRGEIYLKRQYRIKDRKLVYMFDSELTIDDEVLQQALGQHADEKMRTIVTTIQREQNQAIRNDHDDLLLVEGPAGSGKTSVALHRVAYLLYKYRDSIRSQNIVIFSPNRIFSDYISHVLPELGEENVHQTTFQDFAEPFLGWNWDVETHLSSVENLLREQGRAREQHLEAIAFKSSPSFQAVLGNLVNLVIDKSCVFEDIRFGRQIFLSAADQQKMFTENYSYLPVQKRLAKIYQRALFLLRPLKKKRVRALFKELCDLPSFEDESRMTVAREAVTRVKEELDPILKTMNRLLSVKATDWYWRLWQEPGLWEEVAGDLPRPQRAIESLDSLQQGFISMEDVGPLCYLKGELEGYPIKREIQHVVVDEVQDYSPMQLQTLIKTFPRARFTFVGDVFQSLNPYVWQAQGELAEVFGNIGLRTVRLNKSYRSTEEIFHFCNGLLQGKVRAQTVLRHGTKPIVHRVEKTQHIAKLHDLIVDRRRSGYETIAVICETVEECQEIVAGLNGLDLSFELLYLGHERAEFKPGVIVVPVFLAKGLEFDAVIVPEANTQKYGEGYQRRLLYVACSRALHRLDLIYTDTAPLSPFIKDLPPALYSLE